jgi:predicted lipid-binding transport protein (Tim44 family)
LKTPKLIAVLVVLAMAVTPTLSFARAGGGGGRGSGGGISQGGSSSGSIGSRGSRTYDNNGYKPIERSNTPAPSAGRAAAPAAQPQPAVSPPFWQRHPILTGLAAGIAGSWIGHMLFGANNTLAAHPESGTTEGASDSGFGSIFMLLLLMLLGGAVLYYFMKVRRGPSATPAYAGLTRNAVADPVIGKGSVQSGWAGDMGKGAVLAAPGWAGEMAQPQIASPVSAADQDKFKQILGDVQAAWSKQDLDALKRLTTPEVLHYFSTALSENVSREVENHIEDLRVLSIEINESWTEEATDYVTALLRWTARDYTVSLSKQRGEAGYVVEGNEQMPTEVSEAWTFLRYRGGKWLLSAIQQVE